MAGFFDASLDPSQPDSYDAIARKRKLAEMLLAKSGALDSSPVQSWTQGLARMANAWVAGDMGRDADKADKASANAFTSQLGSLLMGGGGSTAAPVSMASASAPSDGKPVSVSDPASQNLQPWQKGLLNAIAAPESGGAYDIRYTPKGGTKFAGFDQHPGIFEPGPAGPSSAAGRYQFTKTTWDGMGGGAFTPEAQDQRALQLAQQDYSRRTGRDLGADIQKNGLTPDILKTLGPTWAGLKDNPQRALAAYAATVGQGAGQQAIASAAPNPADLPSPGAVNAGGAPFMPQADPGLAAAMFDPSRMGGGATDYTLGARGMNGNNNGVGMTEIAPGNLGPMSARTSRQLASAMPGANAPVDLQAVARLLRGDPQPDAPAPAVAAQTPAPAPSMPSAVGGAGLGGGLPQSGGSVLTPEMLQASRNPALTPEALQAFARRAGLIPADPTGGASLVGDLPSARATPAGPQPMPAGPQPGRPTLPLGSPEEQAFTRLEGQPAPAAGPSTGAPAVDRTRQLMMLAMDPRYSPQQRQMAIQAATMLQAQEGVTHVDLGDKIALVNKQGQITGYLPKSRDAADWEIVKDEFGNPAGRFNKRTGEKVMDNAGAPAQAGATPAIPPPPPGVDPKKWRELKTEELANGGPKLSEAQTNANIFANRAQQAHADVSKVEAEGLKLRNAGADAMSQNTWTAPVAGFLRTPEGQAYENGKRNFVNAVLRKESGAAIGAEEYRSTEKQYFPQPGDTKATVDQKRKQRELAIDGLRTAAGPAVNKTVQPATNDGWQEIAPGVRIREKK